MWDGGSQQAPLSRTPPIPYHCTKAYELLTVAEFIASFDDKDV
ncbi:hypothetical protein SAMN05428985_103391 [Nocardioides sp. YR527]|nr:hypothetical protein SAMN05428985_103391 [Nocardioides sp. YR527]